MRTLPLLALLLLLMPLGLRAEPYCQRGADIEMYWIGEWQPVRVITGPDAQGLCMIRYGSIAYKVARARLRPKGGGQFTTGPAMPAPAPAAISTPVPPVPTTSP